MYDARDQLRYLYGLGGLGDLTFALQTRRTIPAVDLGPSTGTMRPMNLQPALQQQGQTATTVENVALYVRRNAVLDAGGLDPAVVARTCDCALAEAASVFQLAETQLAPLRSACYSDPASFVAALQAQASAQGVTLDLARCGGAKPWFKDPKKLALAAAGGVGVGALIWMVLR